MDGGQTRPLCKQKKLLEIEEIVVRRQSSKTDEPFAESEKLTSPHIQEPHQILTKINKKTYTW